MAGPFGDLEPAPGRVLASPSAGGHSYNLWIIVRVLDRGRVTLACPERDVDKAGNIKGRTFSSYYEPHLGEWVGPDVTSVKAYLRLIGKEFA